MKKTNYFFLCFLLISFSSCKSHDDTSPAPVTIDQIADIATFHGNQEADIVVVYAQGGPDTNLTEGEAIDGFISDTQIESARFVVVHQAQTKNPSSFTNTDITFEEAKQFDLESAENLYKVVDFFKTQQDKTVYVIGISFGAYVVQELIAVNGVDVADGYLIIAGRLDIEADVWQPASQGKYSEFVYDNDSNYSINVVEEGVNSKERNLARLFGGFAFNRFSDRLNNVSSLSNVTYVYGNRDDQIGPLSSLEVQFLDKKGANIILSDGGNHDDASYLGLGLLKQTFGLE